ncbi:hypothetical protein RRF57_012286 [Xylaria bambusicola]|uniref:Biogenesis of lysosome-related organelles complex 1 subunit 1 n=1 Tax=Xylaria bambusicola TaxID=326684 RepID=A0AAN7V5G5_9PEZI
MSDPAPVNPGVASPPPVPSSEEERGSSKTSSPLDDHVSSSSAMTPVGGSSCPPPPSLPSSTSKAPPSVSGSRTTATSPPTTVSGGLGPALHHGAGQAPGAASIATMSLNPELPSRDSQLHVAEARAALIASMSNMLDSELQSRAAVLHANAAVLTRQEQDVARATEALRKENDKLAKVAKDAGRKIKELGNVQNWAEVLERDFLVLEETMRLVRNGGADSEDGESNCSECSRSASYSSRSESERERSGSGTRSGSLAGSRKISVSELGEGNGVGEEKSPPITSSKKEKGKGLDEEGASSTAEEGSTAGSTSSLRDPAANGTVSLDEAILESLTEALATDLRMGSTVTKQGTT